MHPSEVVLRAENYRKLFSDYRLDTKKKEYIRDKPSEWAMQFVASTNPEDVEQAIQTQSIAIQNDSRNLIPLILRVLKSGHLRKNRKRS